MFAQSVGFNAAVAHNSTMIYIPTKNAARKEITRYMVTFTYNKLERKDRYHGWVSLGTFLIE
jgi:hypothetical protein